MTETKVTPWALEVVRGREVGRSYPLRPGENLLGNALNGESGVDLADQEGSSPRRMAARQARLTCSERGLTLDDLESPGGTFVNRQRLLPGQARSLQAGDVIQVGGVQLKVVERTPSPPPNIGPVRTGPLPVPFAPASGPACRSWDDFLTVAAQRWGVLREELTSGRLGAFLASIQRPDLIPSPTAPGTADERLDEWLGRLPTTRPSLPELDVHPATLTVRAVPGGGVTRRTIRLTNVGYRLLRSTIKVEATAAPWIVIPAEFGRGPVVTIEQSEVPIDLHIPDQWGASISGGVVVESNGGTKRVEVRLERPLAADAIPEPGAGRAGGLTLVEVVARASARKRVVYAGLAAGLLRLLVLLGGVLVDGSARVLSLRGTVVMDALLGAVVAAWLAKRGGEARDVPPGALAGAIAGMVVAAVTVAACRTVETLFPIPSGIFAGLSVPFWTVLGAGLGWLSLRLIPPHAVEETTR